MIKMMTNNIIRHPSPHTSEENKQGDSVQEQDQLALSREVQAHQESSWEAKTLKPFYLLMFNWSWFSPSKPS